MRARDRDLPELELLSLDEEEPAPSVSTVDVKAKRWWPIALGAAVVAGAIMVTGHDGGAQVAPAPTTPSTSSTLFTPASDSPGARAAADAVRASYPAVLMSSDATALIVLARGGAFEVDVAEPPDTIAGYVALSAGHGRGVEQRVGPRLLTDVPRRHRPRQRARGVFPSQDPARVWLTGVVGGNAAVKEMPVNGTVPPQLATGFIRLPDGYEVAGVAGKELVLSGTVKSLDPYEIVTWDPDTRSADFVTQRGSLLAAADGALAWTRPGCPDCGIYVRRGDTIRIVKEVPNLDSSVPGAFSADGRFLAIAITGAWPGGGTGAIVHGVAVVDLDGPHQFGPPYVATPDIRSTTPVAMTWSGGGALLVRDTSDRIVAYEPHARRHREHVRVPAPRPATAGELDGDPHADPAHPPARERSTTDDAPAADPTGLAVVFVLVVALGPAARRDSARFTRLLAEVRWPRRVAEALTLIACSQLEEGLE